MCQKPLCFADAHLRLTKLRLLGLGSSPRRPQPAVLAAPTAVVLEPAPDPFAELVLCSGRTRVPWGRIRRLTSLVSFHGLALRRLDTGKSWRAVRPELCRSEEKNMDAGRNYTLFAVSRYLHRTPGRSWPAFVLWGVGPGYGAPRLPPFQPAAGPKKPSRQILGEMPPE